MGIAAKWRLSPSLAIVAFMSAFLAVSQAKPAVAAQSTCGTQANYFAGYLGYARLPDSWNETPIGARATITVRNGAVCSTLTYPNNFSTAWVMVYSNTGTAAGYSQAGYMRDSTCMRHFAEYYNSSTSVWARRLRDDLSCLGSGATYSYRTQYVGPTGPYPSPANGHLENWVGNLHLQSTPFDPWAVGWSFVPEYLGETLNLASDVPGISSAVANFDALEIQSVDTGTYRSAPCYLARLVSAGSRYHANASSCVNTSIWTNPLS